MDLSKISDDDRKELAVKAVMEQGKSYAKAAEAFGVSREAVRKRVQRRKKGAKRRTLHPGLAPVFDDRGLDIGAGTLVWDKSAEHSICVDLRDGDDEEHSQTYIEAFQELLEAYKKHFPKGFKKPKKKKSDQALRAIISDAHVGMDPMPSQALFQYEYNGDIFTRNMERVADALVGKFMQHGRFDVVFLEDLGDMQDGFAGQTTRGGHDLPQNMTEGEVFKVCVKAKLNLIKTLIDNEVGNKIVLRSVNNSNHSSRFAEVVNTGVKMMAELMFNSEVVEIDNLTRFMEHREYGDHCFILTHGKDDKVMKKGLPYQLTDKAKEFIHNYIDHYDVESKFIHVDKGDLHQLGYERTKKFDYNNFGSFAPPSMWVQGNFGDTYSCFSVQVVPKHSAEISQEHYFLDYKRVSK